MPKVKKQQKPYKCVCGKPRPYRRAYRCGDCWGGLVNSAVVRTLEKLRYSLRLGGEQKPLKFGR